MKKIKGASFALMMLCGSAFAMSADLPILSKTWRSSSQSLEIINVSELTDDELNALAQGMRPETAVEFSAQTVLPISFFLKGDLANLVEGEKEFGAIEIQQTFYARCIGQELIFSIDLSDWKPFFELMTGTASITLSAKSGQPVLHIGAEVYRRT